MPFDNSAPQDSLAPPVSSQSGDARLILKIEQCVHDGLSVPETLARLPDADPKGVRTEFTRLVGELDLLESLTDYPMGGGMVAGTRPRITEDEEQPAHRIGSVHLTLAVEQCIHQHLDLTATQEKLRREDAREVAAVFARLQQAKDDRAGPSGEGSGRYGLAAEQQKELRRPLLSRLDRRGLQLPEIAERMGIERETLARFLEHHGYLEMVPFDGLQRRRIVSDQAFHAGLGHNVDPSASRIGHVEGMAKAAPFPVFYEERLADMLWTFDLERSTATVEERKADGGKKAALAWLMQHHGYLPNADLARLSGCSEITVKRARAEEETTAAPAPSGGGCLLSWMKAGMPR